MLFRSLLASHAGVFRGARYSSLPTRRRDEKRGPLKMPAWGASSLLD